MKQLLKLFLLIFITSSLNSCSIFDPSSPEAGFITVDSVTLTTEYATQGSTANNITDIWVIVDGDYLGTFPLPARIPIIGKGVHSLSISGGVIENGIAGTRAAYPKYAAYTTTVTINPGETIPLNPVLTYKPFVTFTQIEDFDDASLTLSSTSSGIAPLQITSVNDPNAFEGNSGMVTLDGSASVFEVASTATFALPTTTTSFIELNYKCDIDFTVGEYINLITGVEQRGLLSLRATPVWKKVYITVSDLNGIDPNAFSYKIFIRAEKPLNVTTAKLYFDNLKVLY